MRKKKVEKPSEGIIDPRPQPVRFADLMYITNLTNRTGLIVSVDYRGKHYEMPDIIRNVDSLQDVVNSLFVDNIQYALVPSPFGDGVIPGCYIHLVDRFVANNEIVTWGGLGS